MQLRTIFVVVLLIVLQLCAWFFSLLNLFISRFWDRRYALDFLESATPSELFYESTTLTDISKSYYAPSRYVWLVLHVVGAVVWWNLYFFQLIPRVRHSFNKALHRWLGRVLLVAAFLQTITGIGMAVTSHSSYVKIVSLVYGVAVGYSLIYAAYYARARDIPKHKYWVLRLVGYLQTIAAQRFWFIVLLVCHKLGSTLLYPAFDDSMSLETVNGIVREMFDGSFVMAALTSTYVTEWYLAGNVGMLGPAERTTTTYATKEEGTIRNGTSEGDSGNVQNSVEEKHRPVSETLVKNDDDEDHI